MVIQFEITGILSLLQADKDRTLVIFGYSTESLIYETRSFKNVETQAVEANQLPEIMVRIELIMNFEHYSDSVQPKMILFIHQTEMH